MSTRVKSCTAPRTNMRILYIFPHPDDESFGVAHTMNAQLRAGHDVHLLTLTKGGATRQRHRFGYSVEEMGEVRYKEMLEVSKVLALTEMVVLDLPDSGLKEMDPRDIESIVTEHIERVKPDVVVTYAVYGVSGFHDHLVTHAVVKRVFVELRERHPYLKRLAFQVLSETDVPTEPFVYPIQGSKPEEIDCRLELDDIDVEKARQALDCYVSFQAVLEKTGIKAKVHKNPVFEFFQEDFDPNVTDLFASLPQ